MHGLPMVYICTPVRTKASATVSQIHNLLLLLLLGEELLDEVGLVGARGVDGRSSGGAGRLLGAGGTVDDAANHGGQPADGEVVAADLSASNSVVSDASHCW